jgi:PKD repeat protein
MKKSIFISLSISLSFFFNSSLAQTKRVLDPSNMRDGENVEYCVHHKKMSELFKNPEFAASYEQDKITLDKAKNKGVPKGVVYKIPIVFHILHNGGPENISDEQIYDQMIILNRDFRLQNLDASTVQTPFQNMPTDVEVEFVLATKAPNGSCFKGITRTVSALTADGSDDDAQVTAIRNGNDVFQGNWRGDRYLNVYVVDDAGGAAGYTTNPASWSASSMSNGIWILHNYLGSIGTSSEFTSRALTHEVGHWLNLDHTWGPNNNPGNASSCGSDDAVNDTPNCIGVTSCLLTANTCDDGTNDVIDNVENYMDYSYCSKMFTAGQVARMRAALQISSTGRFNLWQSANLTNTGATGVLSLCKAQFAADRTSICAGEEIQFTDDSYNSVTGWTWDVIPSTGWSFATGSSSTDQNPTIVFNQSGVYTVKLTASDGTNSQTETKTDYIRVAPSASTLPYWEGFENYTTLANLTSWEVVNLSNNNSWTIESVAANSGTKSAKLVNFGQASGNVDELISAPIDMSVVPSSGSVTLSFRYAYRKKTTGDVEYLRVFISDDCGSTWSPRKTLGGSGLSQLTATSSWKPTQPSDWITVHLSNVTNAYFVQNFKMKFRFESDAGNNIYLDDINLYQGASSNEVVVGVNESIALNSFGIYPNPTDNELNVQFNLSQPEIMLFEIMDLTGKKIEKQVIKANSGENLVILNTNNLSSGLYLLNVNSGNLTKTIQFIKN